MFVSIKLKTRTVVLSDSVFFCEYKYVSLLISLFFILHSTSTCAQKHSSGFKVKPEYLGTWNAPESAITVRTEPRKRHYDFTKGKGDFSMTINADKTVSGHIGKAKFENARLVKNRGLPPGWTGVIYIIRCGKIGKIFDTDPLDEKVVELWICPIKTDGTMEVELRYGIFPMSGFISKKN